MASMRSLLVCLLLASTLACAHLSAPREAREAPVEVKVMVVVFSDGGDAPSDWTLEGKDWARNLKLTKKVVVSGLRFPVHCTAESVCVMVAGEGPVDTAVSMMAVGLSPALDLRRTYFVTSGIAGVNPNVTTAGSVAWIRSVVDADNCHEVDARELPEGFPHSRFPMFCEAPWCEQNPGWGGVYTTNDALRAKAIEWTSGVELLDSDKLRKLRSGFAGLPTAAASPRVLTCDSMAGKTYWHGKLLSEWASFWVKSWLPGEGNYCMVDEEDYAALRALASLARAGRVDSSRVLVLRAGSDFDQPGEGVTVLQSLVKGHDGATAAANAFRVASVVVERLVAEWPKWREGIAVNDADGRK